MIKISSFKSFFSRSLWLVPFIFFLSGYFALDLFLHHSYTSTPNVLGQSLSEAVSIISSENLNVRLLSSKEDEKVKEGTVLSQNPTPASSIRPQQTVFLIVSRKKTQPKTPDCCSKQYETLTSELKEQDIPHKVYYVQSNHPSGTCIAQIPEAGADLSSQLLILYVSQKPETSLVLLPSFEGRSVQEVVTFLKKNNFPFSLFHTRLMEPDHTCTTCSIVEQKPLPGSFIDVRNPPTIRLKVNA
jgi:beta-lactam-binding protein with PASTA domain